MSNSVTVGLGEIKISADPYDILVAYGLGSCLGIGMFDPTARVAGLLHAILPSYPNGQGISHALAESSGKREARARYVDSGIEMMIERMVQTGANPRRLVVRMAGGANMLVVSGISNSLNIGARNIDSAYTSLDALRLKLSGQEVGGNVGRTVRFYVLDGRMTIRVMGNQEREV